MSCRVCWVQVNGNNKLKIGLQAKNKHVLREAVEFYDKGLAEKCSDKKLNAVLHCNRAHVHSLLGERASRTCEPWRQRLPVTHTMTYQRMQQQGRPLPSANLVQPLLLRMLLTSARVCVCVRVQATGDIALKTVKARCL